MAMIVIFNSNRLRWAQMVQVRNASLIRTLNKIELLKLSFVLLLTCLMSACSGVSTKPAANEQTVAAETANAPKVIDELSLQEYQQAITLIDNGQLDEADSLLVKLADKYPDLAAPLYNLGVISEAKKDVDGAIGFYNQAIEADKRYYLAYNNLGVIARSQGNFDQALNYYRNGLTIAPDNRELHYNMAVLNEIYLHDYAKAIEHYELYLALFDENGADSPDKNVVSWVKDLKRRSR